MTVLVFESNLMWSPRLKRSLEALGHDAVIVPDTSAIPEGDVAILNLGSNNYDPVVLTKELQTKGIRVIAHAGHKEKQLHELGVLAGCDVLASNSELTFKLEKLLEKASTLSGHAVINPN